MRILKIFTVDKIHGNNITGRACNVPRNAIAFHYDAYNEWSPYIFVLEAQGLSDGASRRAAATALSGRPLPRREAALAGPSDLCCPGPGVTRGAGRSSTGQGRASDSSGQSILLCWVRREDLSFQPICSHRNTVQRFFLKINRK